jgi:hypothetical protein
MRYEDKTNKDKQVKILNISSLIMGSISIIIMIVGFAKMNFYLLSMSIKGSLLATLLGMSAYFTRKNQNENSKTKLIDSASNSEIVTANSNEEKNKKDTGQAGITLGAIGVVVGSTVFVVLSIVSVLAVIFIFWILNEISTWDN